MNNFRFLGMIDVLALISTVYRQRAAFDQNTARQDHPGSPHHDTKAILLRGPKDPSPDNWQEDVPQADYGLLALKEWKPAQTALVRVKRAIQAAFPAEYPANEHVPLGKAMIVQLNPGGFVDWHVDEGPYAEKHLRLHLPLYTNPGAMLYSGGEAVNLLAGGLSFFNNRVLHSAVNVGAQPRIHFIVDVRKAE